MRAAQRLPPPPTASAEPSPDRLDLVAALANLPRRQRQAMVLHYLADIPVAEIATQMGAAEGTVKSWLHRARTTLAARLVEMPAADNTTDASKGVGRA
jgi:RNA polymerase sigma-70 factor (ECF subfamily)